MAEKLILEHREVGPWPMNTYALIDPETNESVLFDPGAEPETLMEMLGDSEPIAIILTHTHPDHIGALDEMRERLDVPVMAYQGALSVDADEWITHGDEVDLGNHTLDVYYTPGHTDNMLSFYIRGDNRCIVGDTIFEGGPGKTWSMGEFRTTLQTLRDVVLQWPDDTICYPGHGPSFRLGDIRDEVEAFLDKNHGAFYGDATWDM